jgi:hypothetical protein
MKLRRRKKMKLVKNKTMATLITLVLMISMIASLSILSTADAQTDRTYLTFLYVTAQPLTGVGQPMFLVYWTDRIPPDTGEIAQQTQSGTLSERAHWTDVKLVVTHPDGTNETINMGASDPVGGGYTLYTPDEVGRYSVQAFFPATWKNSTTYHTLYPACLSPPDYFTVQQEKVTQWPSVPLPTEYWARPIPGPANTWYELAANWLGGAAMVNVKGATGGVTSPYSYGKAPESPHIMWTRQYFPTGSIVDEQFGTVANRYGGYQAVSWSSDPILDGKIHTSPRLTVHDGAGGWEILDLYTGESLFYDPNGTKPSFGQIYLYDTGNEHGLNVYLWKTSGITLPQVVRVPQVQYLGPNRLPLRLAENIEINRTKTPYAINVTGTVRELLDAYTGKTICYIANCSTTGTNVYGKDGSILYYNALNLGTSTAPNYYLQIWNSSAGTMVASQQSTGAWQWRPSGGSGSGASISYFGAVASNNVHDGNIMWSLNASMPSIYGPRNSLVNQTASIQAVREGEYIIFATAGRNDERGTVPGWVLCLSLKRGQEGQKLWESTFTPPLSNSGYYTADTFEGVFPDQEVIMYASETRLKYYAFDMKTGAPLWESDPIEQMSYYGLQDIVWNNTFIAGGTHGGVLRAYDFRTGEIVWNYTAKQEGTESPYGNALVRGLYAADGKLYTSTSEHSESSPLWRTQGLRCLNITTGEEIWKILFWGRGNVRLADGMLIAFDYYDGQVYAFGKGPSDTKVSAPQIVPALGSSITITGRVTDQTPTGRRNVNNELQFALKDSPAISDKDMQAWMEYKFMGQAMPKNAKGVPVSLDTIDPNGNLVHVGDVTSDISGNYGFAYTPEVPGTYQIIATFAGSSSYYGSTATTYLTIGGEPTTPTEQPAVVLPPTEMYFAISTLAIIAVIAIIGALIMIMLRKKP